MNLDSLPKVRMQLAGTDGNAFAILGNFSRSARKQGWDAPSINAVTAQAMAGDYNNLICTILQYVDDSVVESMAGTFFDKDDDDYDNWGDYDEY